MAPSTIRSTGNWRQARSVVPSTSRTRIDPSVKPCPGGSDEVRLGEEFHHNRIELISSQISGVAPAASHRWSKLRLWQSAVRLQHEGRLNLLPLISHAVPFAEAPALFARIDAGEPGLMQAVLDFVALA